MRRGIWLAGLIAGCAACGGPKPGAVTPTPTPTPTPSAAPALQARPDEPHLAALRQLTFGGENAEAYWTPDDRALLFQTKRPPYQCDQIMRMPADGSRPPELVSTGKGRTTCSYTYPGNDRVLYSSTHLAGDACPPEPDHSQGYVWAIYDSYDIFSAKPDGSDLTRLTETPGYDAEATMCRSGKDSGAIVFTSVRDGDLELYRMNADGSQVKRLTQTAGYDGGAFFSADCSKIVWRASRPAPGAELDDYQRLLRAGLVRPTQLELWVANADGSDARQVTYLGAASFAPYFFPDGQRILFSSNHVAGGGKPGREFDIWAINVDGSGLERITTAPGFDGFPMFSADGKRLAFSSNRNQKVPGDTDLYVAEWRSGAATGAGTGTGAGAGAAAADRFVADVKWLADDAREGRGIGTAGLEAAGEYIEARLEALGVEPAGSAGYRFPFEVTTGMKVDPKSWLAIDGVRLQPGDYAPGGFTASGTIAARTVFANYGITAPELKIDDYKGVNAKGRVVVVRRFTPEGGDFANDRPRRMYSEISYKAFNARQHGAVGLIVIDVPEVAAGVPLPAEAALPEPGQNRGDTGIPVLVLTRAAGSSLIKKSRQLSGDLVLEQTKQRAFNVMGIVRGTGRMVGGVAPGPVVVGAHYDHLGMGGHGSLAPGVNAPHNGADDNASGVAALLEVARTLTADPPAGDVVVIAFAGEELGVLGSTALMRAPTAALGKPAVMLNMDMVGRLRDNQVQVLGAESAAEWRTLVPPACAAVGVACSLSGGGYGPSDQTPFYAAGVPVLHFFTGTHSQYHTPDDDSALINAAGGARVAALVAALAARLAADPAPALTYKSAPQPMALGDSRGGASLGTIPDYAGAPGGKAGVYLAGVRPGGPAEQAGLHKGDLIVRIGEAEIRSVEDLMFVLRAAMPGQTTQVVVERGGKRVTVDATYGKSVRR